MSTTRACSASASCTSSSTPFCGARRAIDHDHRPLGVGEKPRRFLHRAGLALRRRGRRVFRDVELLAVVLPDRLLLQAGVERDHHRPVGRRHRDLVGAHERLREVLQRHRRVVPLGEVAHQRVDVLRRMEGRHARRPMRGVEVVAAHDDDRHAVAPGVVDRHRGVLQADRAVAERQQRLAGDLEVAVRHADRGFLMRAGEELRHLVAAVVDQRLVDAAEARSAVRRQIFDVERLDDIDHEIGAGDAADAIAVGLAALPVSAAIVCAVGGSADGRRAARGAGGNGRIRGLRRHRARRRRRRPRRSEICGDRPSGRNPSCPKPCVPWCAPSNELLCGDSQFAAAGGGDCIAGQFVAPGPDRDYLGTALPACGRQAELFGPPSVKRTGRRSI